MQSRQAKDVYVVLASWLGTAQWHEELTRRAGRPAPRWRMGTLTARSFLPSATLLTCLYILEFSLLLTAMAIYKKGERSCLDFLAAQSGRVLLVGLLAVGASTMVIVFYLRRRAPGGARRFGVTLILNLWSVVAGIAAMEVVIRVFAVTTPAGPVFANTLLLPRSWEDVAARNRAILTRASREGSFLVFDEELGWTVGPSRRSKEDNLELARQLLTRRQRRYSENAPAELPRGEVDLVKGLYSSSVEGIRSPRAGMALASVPAKHRRIAIVGDSFTFGLEVRYEETWGHQLEVALGPEYQVLNFGVDGYGVDQAYLRYRRDVLSWHPDTVILGVINDDFKRTMGVYGFLSFPEWVIPFPKPRFVIRGHALETLNVPLAKPADLFAKGSIRDLPFIEYDWSFQQLEWERRFYHHAYSVRLLLSRYPRRPTPGRTVSDEAMKAVNGGLLRSFVKAAREQGSTPIVVFFPSMEDLMPESRGRMGIAAEVLRAEGIPYLDMTDCVSDVNPAERFAILHYSRIANVAVARCLRDSIREASRK